MVARVVREALLLPAGADDARAEAEVQVVWYTVLPA